MSEKKEKFIIFALAGILLLIVCIPVKKKDDGRADSSGGEINNSSIYTEPGAGSTAGSGREGSISGSGTASGGGAGTAFAAADDYDGYVTAMEEELEELLSCMEGAGAVKVMITLQSTGEEIVEKDRPSTRSNLSENDGAGGSRSSNDMNSGETTVFITDADGNQVPYVRKRMQPSVAGVAVLAQGGGNETVRRNISEAIQALFGIDANKIKIAKMKTSK